MTSELPASSPELQPHKNDLSIAYASRSSFAHYVSPETGIYTPGDPLQRERVSLLVNAPKTHDNDELINALVENNVLTPEEVEELREEGPVGSYISYLYRRDLELHDSSNPSLSQRLPLTSIDMTIIDHFLSEDLLHTLTPDEKEVIEILKGRIGRRRIEEEKREEKKEERRVAIQMPDIRVPDIRGHIQSIKDRGQAVLERGREEVAKLRLELKTIKPKVKETQITFGKNQGIMIAVSIDGLSQNFCIPSRQKGLSRQLALYDGEGNRVLLPQLAKITQRGAYGPLHDNPVFADLRSKLGPFKAVYQIRLQRKGDRLFPSGERVSSIDKSPYAIYVIERRNGRREIKLIDNQARSTNLGISGINLTAADKSSERSYVERFGLVQAREKEMVYRSVVRERRGGIGHVYDINLSGSRFSLDWVTDGTGTLRNPNVIDEEGIEHELSNGFDENLQERVEKEYPSISGLNLPRNARRFGFSITGEKGHIEIVFPPKFGKWARHFNDPTVLIYQLPDGSTKGYIIDPTRVEAERFYQVSETLPEEQEFRDYQLIARGTRDNPATTFHTFPSSVNEFIIGAISTHSELLVRRDPKHKQFTAVDLNSQKEVRLRPVGYISEISDRLSIYLNPILRQQQINPKAILDPRNRIYVLTLRQNQKELFDARFKTSDLDSYGRLRQENCSGRVFIIENHENGELSCVVLDQSLDSKLLTGGIFNTGTGLRYVRQEEVKKGRKVEKVEARRRVITGLKTASLVPVAILGGAAGLSGGVAAYEMSRPPLPVPEVMKFQVPVVRFNQGEGFVHDLAYDRYFTQVGDQIFYTGPDLTGVKETVERQLLNMDRKGIGQEHAVVTEGMETLTGDQIENWYSPGGYKTGEVLQNYYIPEGIGEKIIVLDTSGDEIVLYGSKNQIPYYVNDNVEANYIIKYLQVPESDGTGLTYPDLGMMPDGTPILAIDESGKLILNGDVNKPIYRTSFHDGVPQYLILSNGQVVGFALDPENYQQIYLLNDPEIHKYYAKDLSNPTAFGDFYDEMQKGNYISESTTFDLVRPDFIEGDYITEENSILVYKDWIGNTAYPDFGSDRQGRRLKAIATPYVYGNIFGRNIYAIPPHDDLPTIFILEDGTFLGAGRDRDGQLKDPNEALFRSDFSAQVDIKTLTTSHDLFRTLVEIGKSEVKLSDFRNEPYELIRSNGNLYGQKDYQMTLALSDTDVLNLKPGFTPHVYRYYDGVDNHNKPKPTGWFFIINPLNGQIEFVAYEKTGGDQTIQRAVLRRIKVLSKWEGAIEQKTVWAMWDESDLQNLGAIRTINPSTGELDEILIPKDGARYYEVIQPTPFTYTVPMIGTEERLYVFQNQQYRKGDILPNTITYLNQQGKSVAYFVYPDKEVMITDAKNGQPIGIAGGRYNRDHPISLQAPNVFLSLTGEYLYGQFAFDHLPSSLELQHADFVFNNTPSITSTQERIAASSDFSAGGAYVAISGNNEIIGINDLQSVEVNGMSKTMELISALYVLNSDRMKLDSVITDNLFIDRVPKIYTLRDVLQEIITEGPKSEYLLNELLIRAGLGDYEYTQRIKTELDPPLVFERDRFRPNMSDLNGALNFGLNMYSSKLYEEGGEMKLKSTPFELARLLEEIYEGRFISLEMREFLETRLSSGSHLAAIPQVGQPIGVNWHLSSDGQSNIVMRIIKRNERIVTVAAIAEGGFSDQAVINSTRQAIEAFENTQSGAETAPISVEPEIQKILSQQDKFISDRIFDSIDDKNQYVELSEFPHPFDSEKPQFAYLDNNSNLHTITFSVEADRKWTVEELKTIYSALPYYAQFNDLLADDRTYIRGQTNDGTNAAETRKEDKSIVFGDKFMESTHYGWLPDGALIPGVSPDALLVIHEDLGHGSERWTKYGEDVWRKFTEVFWGWKDGLAPSAGEDLFQKVHQVSVDPVSGETQDISGFGDVIKQDQKFRADWYEDHADTMAFCVGGSNILWQKAPARKIFCDQVKAGVPAELIEVIKQEDGQFRLLTVEEIQSIIARYGKQSIASSNPSVRQSRGRSKRIPLRTPKLRRTDIPVSSLPKINYYSSPYGLSAQHDRDESAYDRIFQSTQGFISRPQASHMSNQNQRRQSQQGITQRASRANLPRARGRI